MSHPRLFDTLNTKQSKVNILIRLPNWLGDVVMALPVVQALKKQLGQRAELHLLLQPHFVPLLNALHPDMPCIPLPKKSLRYYFDLWPLRKQAFDAHILFTQSERGDLEARVINANHRIGMSGRWLLNQHYALPEETPFKHTHQTDIWHGFMASFGLQQPADLTPLTPAISDNDKQNLFAKQTAHKTIGLICGTENYPDKRWPIERWCELIESLQADDDIEQIVLFGTANDQRITQTIQNTLKHQDKVLDIAGKTRLLAFIDGLHQCDLIIGNDTGGIHLANAMGVPVLALFGPTNPVNTGPVFDAPKQVLQPAGCAPTGGEDINKIGADKVLTLAKQLMADN